MATGKKNAARLGVHLVFADESGFSLAPLVAKTMIAICVGCCASSPANDRICKTSGNTCKISAIPTSKARFSHTCFLSVWNFGARIYAALATSTVDL